MQTTTTAQRFFLFIATGFAVAIIVGLAVWQSGLSAKQSASTGEAGMPEAAETSISIRAAQLEPRNTPEPERPKSTPLSAPNLSEDVFNDPLLPPRAYIAPEHISPTAEAAEPSVRTMPSPSLSGDSNDGQAPTANQPNTTATNGDRESSVGSQGTGQTPQATEDIQTPPAVSPVDPGVNTTPTDVNVPAPAQQQELPLQNNQTAPTATANEPSDSQSVYSTQAPITGATNGTQGAADAAGATGATNQ